MWKENVFLFIRKKRRDYHAFSRIRFSIEDLHDILSTFWGKLNYLFGTWLINSNG